MHASSSSPVKRVRSFFQYEPQWLLVGGALLLVAACVFPWMRLFAFPLTASSPQIATVGGIREEPIWFASSLSSLFLALWNVPYRRNWVTVVVLGFIVKLWFMYNSLTEWFRFNALTANDPGDRPAPVAMYGLGWYCLVAALSIFAASFVYRLWQKRC